MKYFFRVLLGTGLIIGGRFTSAIVGGNSCPLSSTSGLSTESSAKTLSDTAPLDSTLSNAQPSFYQDFSHSNVDSALRQNKVTLLFFYDPLWGGDEREKTLKENISFFPSNTAIFKVSPDDTVTKKKYCINDANGFVQIRNDQSCSRIIATSIEDLQNFFADK